MAQTGLTPLPPTIHHSSTPLKHGQAHAFLSSFLSLAELDPSLRPDSVLTERGPTSSSRIANPNLTLSHLGRIKLGMEGKRVGGGDLDGFLGVGGRRVGQKRKRDEPPTPASTSIERRRPTQKSEVIQEGRDQGAPVVRSSEQEDGWQNREDYDLAQEDEVDVGNPQRQNATGGVEDVEETIGVEADEEDAAGVPRPAAKKEGSTKNAGKEAVTADIDKDERKRLKKERLKKEKKTTRAG